MDMNTESWKKESQEETDKTVRKKTNKQTTVVHNTLNVYGWNTFHQHF